MANSKRYVKDLKNCLHRVSTGNYTYSESTVPVFSSPYLKSEIGNSTLNNRVWTVSQTIRFLTRRNASKNQKAVGAKLKSIYDNVRPTLKLQRLKRGSVRSDAYDINELIFALENSKTK